jgi:DNA ligase D-like protein (predicted polymerase)
MKEKFAPMLCKPSNSLPKGDDWIFELKYDGYRIISHIENGGVKLMTRNGNDYTDKFFEIGASLSGLAGGKEMVLDGEIVVVGKGGKSDFNALQNYFKNPKGKPLVYMIFDILSFDGADLREKPLMKRKEILRKILEKPPKNLHFSEYTDKFSEKDFEKVCENGHEGMVAKRKNSAYGETRNGDWLKLKCKPHSEFRISSPDKILFENDKITKAEIAKYYGAVAERMLPLIENRFLSVIRCPSGIAAPCFFRKHPSSDSEENIVVNSVEEIIAEVQLNTLEFHTWGSKADSPNNPDVLVFDLDPDESMELFQVHEGLVDLKNILDDLSLTSFLKTSGNKGYHIVIPLNPSPNWEVFSTFAKKIALLMEQKHPSRYTSNIRKINRKGKIFIDYLRNTRAQTSIAPYSIRAKNGAAVSMPISWQDYKTTAPNQITMQYAIQKLAEKDPWADFFKVQLKQQLK